MIVFYQLFLFIMIVFIIIVDSFVVNCFYFILGIISIINFRILCSTEKSYVDLDDTPKLSPGDLIKLNKEHLNFVPADIMITEIKGTGNLRCYETFLQSAEYPYIPKKRAATEKEQELYDLFCSNGLCYNDKKDIVGVIYKDYIIYAGSIILSLDDMEVYGKIISVNEKTVYNQVLFPLKISIKNTSFGND